MKVLSPTDRGFSSIRFLKTVQPEKCPYCGCEEKLHPLNYKMILGGKEDFDTAVCFTALAMFTQLTGDALTWKCVFSSMKLFFKTQYLAF